MMISKPYKRKIVPDLARGNPESLEPISDAPVQEYPNFDKLTKPSWGEECHGEVRKSLHLEDIPPSQMELELQKAIAQIKPNERHDVAREFLKRLKANGLSDRALEQKLSICTRKVNRMSADDVTKLAAFTYHTHPDIFQDALAEKPAIVKFLSNPFVGAILDAIAAKWLGNRR